jgi:hypothetical protein
MSDTQLSVDVLRLRDEGGLLPRFRLAFLRPVRGQLVVREEAVADLNRHALTARLLDGSVAPATDLLPPLVDAVLRHMTANEWVFTGFERIDKFDRRIDYAQTWLVTPGEVRTAP